MARIYLHQADTNRHDFQKREALENFEQKALQSRTEAVATAQMIDATFGLNLEEREYLHSSLSHGATPSLKERISHEEAFAVASSINHFLVLLSVEDQEEGSKAWEAIPKVHQMWLSHHARKNGADPAKMWESEMDRERYTCAGVTYLLSLEMDVQPQWYVNLEEAREVLENLDATGS